MNDAATSVLTERPARSSGLTVRLMTFGREYQSQIEIVLATAIYLGFACYLTWPLVTNLGHSIYGAPGDPYGTISFFHLLAEHHYNPFLPGTIHQLAAPEGQPIAWPRNLASAPEVSTLYLLAALFGAIPAYGLYSLLGYTLTGVVTFLFARRLTGNTWAALIAGWAFAFYPFAALNGQGHPDFVHGWVLALGIWRMVELMLFPTRRNGVLAGLAVAFAMWWSPYFILFVGITYVTVTVAALIIAQLDGNIREMFMPQLIATLIVVTFLAILVGLSLAGQGESIGARTNTLRDLNIYAARPLEYLLPDAQSPVFGGATSGYLNSIRHGVGALENTLYVGVTIMLLALVAFVSYVRRRLTPRLGRAVLVLSLVAVAAATTSMPPEPRVFGARIPFPSHFIWQVTQTWRVYERFVMIVMLALSVLAAVGLDRLTRGRGAWVKIGIMSLATVAIPLDLWAPQSGKVERIPSPGIYKTLAHQPPGLVAEYPLAGASFNNYGDLLHQDTHKMPMINGFTPGSFEELRAYSLSNLANPTTAPRLATLGVRYVLVDSAPPAWDWPPSGTPGAGFHLIAHEPYGDLYVVTAHPSSSALAAAGKGFIAAEVTDKGSVTALERESGEIELTGSCTSCNGMLSMALASYRGQSFQVTISDSHGRVLSRTSVTGATQVKIPLQFERKTTLTMTTSPGPQPIAEVPESPKISVLMTNLEFTDASGQGTPPTHEKPSSGGAG